jgi:adenylate cyclase
MVEHITQALWLPWIAPVLALLGTVSWAFTEKRLQLEMERLQLRRLFSRYVPQEVLPELLRRSGELGLAGVQRNITVLFVDVRGFTALAEHLPPVQVMQVLNLYLETMAASVRQHGGMVDKFLGDGLMAVFGAPIPHQDPVQAAVYCAVDMHIRVNAIVPPPSIATLPGIGVGVHTGEAVLCTVGGKERLEYTAMGDVVNVAARLEEMAPAGTVFLSGDVVQKLWETKLQSMCKPLGMRKVRGKRQEMTVYQVECISGGQKRDVNEADATKTDTLEAAATP